MMLLARADSPITAAIQADTLRAAGIRCEVRNTTLFGAVGEIPWQECAPQLWLADAADAPRARQILAEIAHAPQGASWTCTVCGEVSGPQFGACWRCGATRPA